MAEIHPETETPSAPFHVPSSVDERKALCAMAADYICKRTLTPPLLLEEIENHVEALIQAYAIDPELRAFLLVVLNNEVWRPVMASVPYNRRTLLLPPCLRSSRDCPAVFDPLGLLCERCGRCNIASLSAYAEDLGYTVLVAEGTRIVASLVERGRIDAVIGISCMPALERTFVYMLESAVPGLAVPLFGDGCKDTGVDTEWIKEAIAIPHDSTVVSMVDMPALRETVEAWFRVEKLREALRCGTTEVEQISIEWLARTGKRWRPMLVVAVYQALRQCGIEELPDTVVRAAYAVECIHKASLILDDIQDADAIRYGDPTVHTVHGTPVALTAGLYLLGQGYHLLATCGIPPADQVDMLELASWGHCALSVGQGRELWWMEHPSPLCTEDVLSIFALKTAPSFDVVFRLGAICAEADRQTHEALRNFSLAIGVGYQIQDDLHDVTDAGDGDDILAQRPSIMLALAYDHADEAGRAIIASAYTGKDAKAQPAAIRALLVQYDIEQKARELLQTYREKALHSLAPLTCASLKIALFRLTGTILHE